jgi:nitroreductase
MNRKTFLKATGTTIIIAGVSIYLTSEKSNFERKDMKGRNTGNNAILPDERIILYLASLAPSGHNTQPWFVKYIAPFHWIICNDKSKWLQAVDPTQRETILSIGAFLQNLEYAANNLGYNCSFIPLAATNEDENIVEVTLNKTANVKKYDIEKIKLRRTVRSNFLRLILKTEDVLHLTNESADFVHYIPNSAKEYQRLNEQTIEANRMQAYRDDAQNELANWIRFSGKDAERNSDGLTLASMEIGGIPGWYLRNFYAKNDVLKKRFREQSIDKVVKQVSSSAGWLLITSKNDLVTTLLETGKQMQRLFLKVRQRGIAIHPMTQIIEETSTNKILNRSTGITDPVQFILRTGYLKEYPEPVSLRRPVDRFVHL